jgi:hypothetical protein
MTPKILRRIAASAVFFGDAAWGMLSIPLIENIAVNFASPTVLFLLYVFGFLAIGFRAG